MIRFRVELILRHLKENNISKAEFCRRVGISRRTLYRLIKTWEPFIPEGERVLLNQNITGSNKKQV